MVGQDVDLSTTKAQFKVGDQGDSPFPICQQETIRPGPRGGFDIVSPDPLVTLPHIA